MVSSFLGSFFFKKDLLLFPALPIIAKLFDSLWAKKRNPFTFVFFLKDVSWRMFFSYLFPLLSPSWQGEMLAHYSNFIRCMVACTWGGVAGEPVANFFWSIHSSEHAASELHSKKHSSAWNAHYLQATTGLSIKIGDQTPILPSHHPSWFLAVPYVPVSFPLCLLNISVEE